MNPYLKPSEDSKTKFRPGQKNTFGLTPGPEGSCPWATSGKGGCWADGKCKICYAWRLSQFRKNTKAVLDGNFELLKSYKGKARIGILVQEFRRFLYEGGKGDKFYRLHWSGDIFSPDYAKDLMLACKEVPEVKFWNFTRNFDPKVLNAIAKYKPDNLVQYLSADAVNLDMAMKAYEKYPGVFAMSYMGDSVEPFEKTWTKTAGRTIHSCPSNFKHTSVEFMCKKCKMCLKGSCVFFKTRR